MINKNYKYYRCEDKKTGLSFVYEDENGKIKEDFISYKLEDGTKNPDVNEIINEVKKTMDEYNNLKITEENSVSVDEIDYSTINNADLRNELKTYIENMVILNNSTVNSISDEELNKASLAANEAINKVAAIIKEDPTEMKSVEKIIRTLDTIVAPKKNKQKATITDAKPSLLNKVMSKFSKSAKMAILAVSLTTMLTACGGKDKAEDSNKKVTVEAINEDENVDNEEVDPGSLIDELREDSRYTYISEENIYETSIKFKAELDRFNLDIPAEDIMGLVFLTNISHIYATNPELAKEIASSLDYEVTMVKNMNILGKISTVERDSKEMDLDWTMIILDEKDKKIADHGVEMIKEIISIIDATDDYTKVYNEEISILLNNSDESKEKVSENVLKDLVSEKEYLEIKDYASTVVKSSDPVAENNKIRIARIQNMVMDRFIMPNMDNSYGYKFSDGTEDSYTQEVGADFYSDVLTSSILTSHNIISNFINTENVYEFNEETSWGTRISAGEVTNKLMIILESVDNHSNLSTIFNDCQNYEQIEDVKSK